MSRAPLEGWGWTWVPLLFLVALLTVTYSLGFVSGRVAEQVQAEYACHNPCPNKTLLIEGCDKHGRNCAPIYICGIAEERDDG